MDQPPILRMRLMMVLVKSTKGVTSENMTKDEESSSHEIIKSEDTFTVGKSGVIRKENAEVDEESKSRFTRNLEEREEQSKGWISCLWVWQLIQLWVGGDHLVLGAGQLVGEAGDDGPGPQAIPPEQGALWS